MSGEIPGAQNDAETLLGLLKLAGGADLKKVIEAGEKYRGIFSIRRLPIRIAQVLLPIGLAGLVLWPTLQRRPDLMLRVLTALASMSKAIPFFGTFISARIMSRAEPIKRMLETQQKEYKLLVPLSNAAFNLHRRLHEILYDGERYLENRRVKTVALKEQQQKYETLFLIAEYFAWREAIRRQMHQNESHAYLHYARCVDAAFSCGWSMLKFQHSVVQEALLRTIWRQSESAVSQRGHVEEGELTTEQKQTKQQKAAEEARANEYLNVLFVKAIKGQNGLGLIDIFEMLEYRDAQWAKNWRHKSDDGQDDGTALHVLCADKDDPAMALLLISFGVDPRAKDAHGKTALCADRPYIKRMWPYLKHVAADEEERQNQKQIFAALAARKQLSKVQELMRNGWCYNKCIRTPPHSDKQLFEAQVAMQDDVVLGWLESNHCFVWSPRVVNQGPSAYAQEGSIWSIKSRRPFWLGGSTTFYFRFKGDHDEECLPEPNREIESLPPLFLYFEPHDKNKSWAENLKIERSKYLWKLGQARTPPLPEQSKGAEMPTGGADAHISSAETAEKMRDDADQHSTRFHEKAHGGCFVIPELHLRLIGEVMLRHQDAGQRRSIDAAHTLDYVHSYKDFLAAILQLHRTSSTEVIQSCLAKFSDDKGKCQEENARAATGKAKDNVPGEQPKDPAQAIEFFKDVTEKTMFAAAIGILEHAYDELQNDLGAHNGKLVATHRLRFVNFRLLQLIDCIDIGSGSRRAGLGAVYNTPQLKNVLAAEEQWEFKAETTRVPEPPAQSDHEGDLRLKKKTGQVQGGEINTDPSRLELEPEAELEPEPEQEQQPAETNS